MLTAVSATLQVDGSLSEAEQLAEVLWQVVKPIWKALQDASQKRLDIFAAAIASLFLPILFQCGQPDDPR